jgi:cytochrome c5
MAPMGSLCRAGEDCGGGTAMAAAVSAGGGEPRSGEAIYGQYCVACHAMGVGGAPTFADVEAWAPRIAKGMDALYQSTYTGIGVMPARGTCMDCTDEELQATVDYMVDEAQ